MKKSILITFGIACIISFSCNSKKDYEISMSNNYMKTSLNIENGIQIDEIEVDCFSKDNLPYIFSLKESFNLRRKTEFKPIDRLKNGINFNKPTNGYEWINDSTWGLFDISAVKYKYIGFISTKNKSDTSYQQTFDVYPRTFKPNSWYLIDFKPSDKFQKKHAFLFVTPSLNFKFYPLKEVGE